MNQPNTAPDTSVYIPPFRKMLWETAFRALGGSGHVGEIAQRAIEIGDYTESQQAALMPNGRTSRLRFKVQWCLTALKAVGYLDNSGKGVWALNDAGQRFQEADISGVRKQINAHYRALSQQRKQQRRDSTDVEGAPDEEVLDGSGELASWKDDLLSRIKAIAPPAFERRCSGGVGVIGRIP